MITDTADDIVTDEMVGDAFCAWHGSRGTDAERIDAALRAVAPMIAARTHMRDMQNVVVAEHNVIANELFNAGLEDAADYVLERAAAIRARGETTPARRPGEIDWPAMDKED
jgi:hypothetical protein